MTDTTRPRWERYAHNHMLLYRSGKVLAEVLSPIVEDFGFIAIVRPPGWDLEMKCCETGTEGRKWCEKRLEKFGALLGTYTRQPATAPVCADTNEEDTS